MRAVLNITVRCSAVDLRTIWATRDGDDAVQIVIGFHLTTARRHACDRCQITTICA